MEAGYLGEIVSLGRREAAELGWRRRCFLGAEDREREKRADGRPALQEAAGSAEGSPVGEGHRQGRAAWWQQVLRGGHSWNGRESKQRKQQANQASSRGGGQV